MGWNGKGQVIRQTPVASGPTTWADTKAAGDVNITTADHDYQDQDLALAIQNTVALDGQSVPTANLPMGGFKHTGVQDGSNDTDYASLKQVKAAASVIADMRGARMVVSTAAVSATFSATEIIVAAAYTGLTWKITMAGGSAINLGTTGAGGMDTGSAPASGYVAIYAIYNSTTGASALLAMDCTSNAAPDIYSNGSAPAGYNASALVSVWPTNGSRQFVAGVQVNRIVKTAARRVITTSTQQASPTSLSISSGIPLNAKAIDCNVGISSTSSGTLTAQLYSTTYLGNAVGGAIGTAANTTLTRFMIVTAQTVLYVATASAGTMTFFIDIFGYDF